MTDRLKIFVIFLGLLLTFGINANEIFTQGFIREGLDIEKVDSSALKSNYIYLQIDKVTISIDLDVDNYLKFYITDIASGDTYTGKVMNLHRYMYTPFSLYGIEDDEIVTAEYDFILEDVQSTYEIIPVTHSPAEDLITRVYRNREFFEISESEFSDESKTLTNQFAYEYHFKDLHSQGYIILDETESYVEKILTKAEYNNQIRYYKKVMSKHDLYGFYWPFSISRGMTKIVVPF